ncbi:MAG: M20 family metallopeptidase [Desulfohalobiaceae bacterium]
MKRGATPINSDRLRSLLRDMVDIYSPSGKEGQITGHLSGYLRERGLPVSLTAVTEGRHNIEVVSPGSEPRVAFLGHLDTVPAFDIERYESEERDGQLYGLGSADMKAGCAALIEAFLSLHEEGVTPKQSGLFLVVGEEEVGDGTTALLAERSFSHAVVAEPTTLRPCLAHYGYVEMLVRSFGTRRHASMSGREYNAIFAMLRMLLKLGGVLEADHPETVLNIRDLHSGESGFAVPDRCEAWVDLHIPPGALPDRFAGELAELARGSLSGSVATGYEIEFPTLIPGYRLADQDSLVESLRSVFASLHLEWAPDSFRSHSDANLMHAQGCSPVVLGPGQLAKAHTRDESVDLEQVSRAAGIYRDLLLHIEEIW